MSKLTLDETIKHCLEVAEKNETQADKIGIQFIGSAMDKRATDCRECAAEHRQLAEWLMELLQRREWCAQYEVEQISNLEQYDMLLRECEILNERYKEAVRLLKVAVEDIGVTVAKVYNGGLICECCKWKSQMGECCCPDDGGCDVAYRWRHADEALKLIGDEPNGI